MMLSKLGRELLLNDEDSLAVWCEVVDILEGGHYTHSQGSCNRERGYVETPKVDRTLL